jgi:hypothetical protein
MVLAVRVRVWRQNCISMMVAARFAGGKGRDGDFGNL